MYNASMSTFPLLVTQQIKELAERVVAALETQAQQEHQRHRSRAGYSPEADYGDITWTIAQLKVHHDVAARSQVTLDLVHAGMCIDFWHDISRNEVACHVRSERWKLEPYRPLSIYSFPLGIGLSDGTDRAYYAERLAASVMVGKRMTELVEARSPLVMDKMYADRALVVRFLNMVADNLVHTVSEPIMEGDLLLGRLSRRAGKAGLNDVILFAYENLSGDEHDLVNKLMSARQQAWKHVHLLVLHRLYDEMGAVVDEDRLVVWNYTGNSVSLRVRVPPFNEDKPFIRFYIKDLFTSHMKERCGQWLQLDEAT